MSQNGLFKVLYVNQLSLGYWHEVFGYNTQMTLFFSMTPMVVCLTISLYIRGITAHSCASDPPLALPRWIPDHIQILSHSVTGWYSTGETK